MESGFPEPIIVLNPILKQIPFQPLNIEGKGKGNQCLLPFFFSGGHIGVPVDSGESLGVLNDILHDAITMNEPPYIKGKQLKIYYATQAGVCPPTFILFVNDIRRMHFSYERYLENQFRKAFGFEGTPIRFILRNKNQKGDDVK